MKVKENKEIWRNQLRRAGGILSELPGPYFPSMEVTEVINKYGISKKLIAEKSGIDYRRVRNLCGSSGNVLNPQEVEALSKAVSEIVTGIIQDMLIGQKA